MTRLRSRPAPPHEENGLCWGCGKTLTGRQRRYCSGKCSTSYWASYQWGSMVTFVFHRDDWTCQMCGARYPYGWGKLEAHHIVPIADGGQEFDRENVQTLCEPCHKRVTAEWHARKAEARHGVKQGMLQLGTTPLEQLSLFQEVTP